MLGMLLLNVSRHIFPPKVRPPQTCFIRSGTKLKCPPFLCPSSNVPMAVLNKGRTAPKKPIAAAGHRLLPAGWHDKIRIAIGCIAIVEIRDVHPAGGPGSAEAAAVLGVADIFTCEKDNLMLTRMLVVATPSRHS